MPEMSPGTALRKIQQAHAGLKKARQALRLVREADRESNVSRKTLTLGWSSLAQAHKLIAEIPLEAVNDEVMTKQLALQRYATATLVRLRRLLRNEGSDPDGDDVEDDEF